jgi:hypothetical protein
MVTGTTNRSFDSFEAGTLLDRGRTENISGQPDFTNVKCNLIA